jgi:hypothetical protein
VLEITSWGEWLIAAGAVASAVTALVGLWRKVLRPGWALWMIFYRSGLAAHALIEAQLTPNGGASLIDRIGRTESRLDELHQAITCIQKHLGAREGEAVR